MARKTGFKDVLVFGGILILGSVAVARFNADDQASAQSGALQREARRLDQEAEASRQAGAKAALEAQKAEEKARQDAEGAAKMGTTLAHYRWGDEHAAVAASVCQYSAADQARYGSRRDWMPDYNWSVNSTLAAYGGQSDRSVYIQGRDLQLKNEFGTMEYVLYSCVAVVDPAIADTANALSRKGWTAHIITVKPRGGY